MRTHRIAVVAALALLAATLLPAAAGARSSYCSKAQGFCTAVDRKPGYVQIRFLAFTLRGRVRVCETHVLGRDCRRLRLRPVGKSFHGFSVRWSRHFEDFGPGRYRLTFAQHGRRLGPALSFTRR